MVKGRLIQSRRQSLLCEEPQAVPLSPAGTSPSSHPSAMLGLLWAHWEGSGGLISVINKSASQCWQALTALKSVLVEPSPLTRACRAVCPTGVCVWAQNIRVLLSSSPGTGFLRCAICQTRETFPQCPAVTGGSCTVAWRASEGLKTPLSLTKTLQLSVLLSFLWPFMPQTQAPSAVIRQQLAVQCVKCWTAYLLPSSSRIQPPPLPTADEVGPTPGLLCIRFWHSEFSTCVTEVLPYSPGYPAGWDVKGSWCRARRSWNHFCFLSVMLSVVSQQPLPLIARKCRDTLVFPSSWDCFHIAEPTGVFVPPRLGWPFPQTKRRVV